MLKVKVIWQSEKKMAIIVSTGTGRGLPLAIALWSQISCFKILALILYLCDRAYSTFPGFSEWCSFHFSRWVHCYAFVQALSPPPSWIYNNQHQCKLGSWIINTTTYLDSLGISFNFGEQYCCKTVWMTFSMKDVHLTYRRLPHSDEASQASS